MHGHKRQLGEIWEGPREKHLRLRFTCEVLPDHQNPSVVILGKKIFKSLFFKNLQVPILGCLFNGMSHLFVPYGQAARFGKRYYFCGGSWSASQSIDWSSWQSNEWWNFEIPCTYLRFFLNWGFAMRLVLASYSYCTLHGKRIELLSTGDWNGVRYLCQYSYTETSKTILVPIGKFFDFFALLFFKSRLTFKKPSIKCLGFFKSGFPSVQAGR